MGEDAVNKRMREPFHTLIWKASIGYNDSWSHVDPEVLEKFAELIVTECLKVVDTRYNGLSDKDSIRLFKMIEDHVGMKIDMRYTEAEHKYFADLAEKYEQD